MVNIKFLLCFKAGMGNSDTYMSSIERLASCKRPKNGKNLKNLNERLISLSKIRIIKEYIVLEKIYSFE